MAPQLQTNPIHEANLDTLAELPDVTSTVD